MLRRCLALALCALALTTFSPSVAAPSKPLKMIAFMSDFDVKEDAVAICKAVMEQVAPGVRVLDITHQVEPYNIAQAARFLAGTAPYMAADAVFVTAVDPGVGSPRRALIVKSKRGQYFVLPDNGLITLIEQQDGLMAAREISNVEWMIGAKRSSTFHGRDIFSSAAAHLARGDDWTRAGPEVDLKSLIRLDLHNAVVDAKGAQIEVIGFDGPYGNLVLNMPAEVFASLGYKLGDQVPVTLNGESISYPFVRTFADVPEGKELFYIDSRGRLSLAINMGDFSKIHGVAEGARLVIPRKMP
jgi:S-adenosylmethionine hydrolase